jgi:hypothetical protein
LFDASDDNQDESSLARGLLSLIAADTRRTAATIVRASAEDTSNLCAPFSRHVSAANARIA